MASRCELLLYLASRAQHVAETIRPALEKGAVVLCDRFADATMAYQGYGRGLGPATVARLNRFVTAGLAPDLAILLDVPVAVGLSRKRRAGGLDRLDREHPSFHEAVRRGYLRIARQNPRRVRVVDGTASEDVVAHAIDRIVQPRLRARRAGLTRVGRRKIVILDNADLLRREAANALLKTIEEPPPDSLIILVSSRPEALLPTIRSRCQEIRFAPLALDQVEAAVRRQRGLPQEDTRFLAVISGGRLGLALEADPETLRAERAEFLRLVSPESVESIG